MAHPAFVDDDRDLALGRREREVERDEALPRARLQVLEHALVAGVVGDDELEAGGGRDHLAGLVDRQHAAVVGERMQHHDRVLPRLDDLVQIADRARAHRARERPVLPDGRRGRTRKRPTRSLAVRSSWQETVTSGRPSRQAMCSTKRVLPQPVGPLSMTARLRAWHCSKTATSSPGRQVERLLQPGGGRTPSRRGRARAPRMTGRRSSTPVRRRTRRGEPLGLGRRHRPAGQEEEVPDEQRHADREDRRR